MTKRWIQEAALRHGFDLCGVAPAVLDERHREHYRRWLDNGYHGEMRYMERRERRDLATVMPNVRSVICLAMNYNTAFPRSTESPDPTRGWIARYAWGDDYHHILRERMENLVEELRAEVGEGLEAKVYVDTGPLLERALAWAAGLGWIAKNTCLINEEIGSWFFLGEILTNLEVAESEFGIPAPDRCGTCTACLEACPTGAIAEPYVLDATRCISYYTIEVKGAIPEQMRPQMGRHVFGCDICQDVCPWNRSPALTPLPAFQPRPFQASRPGRTGVTPDDDSPSAVNPPLEFLATLSEEQFHALFCNSPVRRPKYRGFLRNVAVAMGNSGNRKFLPLVERLARHPDPIVREHAQWALARLNSAGQ
ncbi:MAG TPA: tRNA epoxyqueuosine(34) reductase QueG [Terriglobia bacterium]|nr:tRNA epoxyqueuosine(34) reductase QueG [Terriglobia bacterium]